MFYSYLIIISMSLLYNQDKIVPFLKIISFYDKIEITGDSIRDLKQI